MSDKPTVAERYLSATEAKSLLVRPVAGPVDVLMAAGMAAQGKPLRIVALTLHRMRESGRTAGFDGVCEALTAFMMRSARAAVGFKQMRHKVVERVVFWWLNDVCKPCHGRGHPVIPGTPVMDESRKCDHCAGSGKVPLERIVQTEFIDEARRLASEISRATDETFGSAMRRMR